MDYDGTLADHGAVGLETLNALRRLRDTGRRLVLVTGREMEDLRHALPETALFERIVAENGGVLYDPATGLERALAPPPPVAFVQRLIESSVEPISVGRTIVATWTPHEKTILSTIAELGLELQISFNKSAVMVLPAGVNKGTGLKAALDDLELSPLNVVAIGDDETAVGQRRDGRLELAERRGRVDQELRSRLRAVGVEGLGADRPARRVAAGLAAIRPGNDEAAGRRAP